MLALELEAVRDVSLAIVGGAAVIALVLAWLAKAVVSKLLAVAALAAVGAVVWWQRADVQSCADQVVGTLTPGATDDATCRFFGQDVTILG